MYGGGKNSIDRWDIRRAIRVPRSDLAAFVECLASAKRERAGFFPAAVREVTLVDRTDRRGL